MTRMRALFDRLRVSLVAPLVLVAAVYLLVGYSAGYNAGSARRYAGNPSIFIKAGSAYAKKPALLPDGGKIFDGPGYDGQFYFYFAQDPFLTGVVGKPSDASSPLIDVLGYRYQRILYPLVSWVASGTSADPNVLQWVLPLVNLLAILASGFLLARFLSARGRSPWWSVLYMLSLGLVAGAVNDLADPFATSLFLAGVIWWYDGRRRAAILMLTLTLLARETYFVPVSALAVVELLRLKKGGLPFLIPPGVWIAWQIFLSLALTATIFPADVEKPQIVPLEGVIDRFRIISQENAIGPANWQFAFIGALVVISGYLLWMGAVVVVGAIRARTSAVTKDQVLLVVAGATVLLIPFYTSALWRNIESYSRYAAPVAGLLLMIFATRRSRAAAGFAIALFALTLVNPVIGFLPTTNGIFAQQSPPVATPVVGAAGAGPAGAVRTATVGFAALEKQGADTWRWAVAPRATLALADPTRRTRRVRVTATLRAPTRSAVAVTIRYPDGGTQDVNATSAGVGISRTVTLPGAGAAGVGFTTTAGPHHAPGDARPLYYQLVNLALAR